MKQVYVLLKTELLDGPDGDAMFTDVVGVFTTKKQLAKHKFQDTDTVFYEVKAMPVNEIIQDDFVKSVEELIITGQMGVKIKNGKIKFVDFRAK